MEINEEHLQWMYSLFGRKVRNEIRESVEGIIKSLESMELEYREAVIAILDEEVKRFIIFD